MNSGIWAEKLEKELWERVIPFWIDNAIDPVYDGYFHLLDRAGVPYGTNKGMWVHGRFVWLLSWLTQTGDASPALLDAAATGYRFITAHGRDVDRRWWYELTRDGTPYRKRRYLFTEVFVTLGLSVYASAVDDEGAAEAARGALDDLEYWLRRRDSLPSKVDVRGRIPTRGHSMTMILINLYQELRRIATDPLVVARYTARISLQIDELVRYFVKPEQEALLERVGDDGSILDTPEGREINPGHAIETAWFLLDEAEYRRDAVLRRRALSILDWSLEWGWDVEYGGIYAFRDLRNRPSPHIEGTMKYWWPHTEAMYATAAAWGATGDPRYAVWFERIAGYAFDVFRDPQGGEWFGYLNRDGSVASEIVGSLWKGPFHLPRALHKCALLLRGNPV